MQTAEAYLTCTEAPVKRLKPMHLLYRPGWALVCKVRKLVSCLKHGRFRFLCRLARYFGVEGSLYTVKVAPWLLFAFSLLRERAPQDNSDVRKATEILYWTLFAKTLHFESTLKPNPSKATWSSWQLCGSQQRAGQIRFGKQRGVNQC